MEKINGNWPPYSVGHNNAIKDQSVDWNVYYGNSKSDEKETSSTIDVTNLSYEYQTSIKISYNKITKKYSPTGQTHLNFIFNTYRYI